MILEAARPLEVPMSDPSHLPPDACPECGAPPIDGMGCFEQMGAVCAWEWNDPELAALHFVTVASYNLQHPAQFTDEVLRNLAIAYREALDEGLSNREVLRRTRERWDYQGSKRILRPEGDRRPVFRRWPLTLANVYLPDRPEGASDRVRAWAAAIRREL